MDKEAYEKHKPFAGETKPSMTRRRIGHDYSSRRMYLITMTVEGRRPLLGQLAGTEDEARIELTALGKAVQDEWMAVTAHHPEVESIALQIMPDHLHGILFVKREMPIHLGQVINGFKASTNKHYRRLILGQGTAPGAPAPAGAPAGAAPAPSHSQPQGGGAPVGASAPAGVPVPCAAAPQQRKESPNPRTHGFFWSPNYNDHVLTNQGELQRWLDYLHDNPRRLLVKRNHPEYFRVRFGLQVGLQTCDAIGNRYLLDYPEKLQVQCSRSLTDEQLEERKAFCLGKARQGAVLVSPAISKGEKLIMRAALDARLPLVFLSAEGFTHYTKPGLQFYEACAEGRLLILAPWGHDNRKKAITRSECMTLNALAQMICNNQPNK